MIETFSVRNIKCGGCVNAIRDGLAGFGGVTHVEVSIEGGTVQATGENLDRVQLAQKLAELGYPEATAREE